MGKSDNTGLLLLAGGLTLAFVLSNSSNDKMKDSAPIKLTGKPVDFITKMLPYALAAQKKYPQVPWELILAFSGLESGWGKSAPQYNFFGMKPGKAWTGKTQQFDTTEYLPKATGYNFPKVYSVTPSGNKYKWKVRDTFRAFDNPLDAFIDFCKFITGGRYKNAWGSKNIRDIVTNIWKAGYATDPNYVDKIMKLVASIQEVAQKFVKK